MEKYKKKNARGESAVALARREETREYHALMSTPAQVMNAE